MNASVAIPWCGLKSGNSENRRQYQVLDENLAETPSFSSPASFVLNQEFFLESFPKGSATWPEEKLPTSSPTAKSTTLNKSQYKFLKNSCQNIPSSHVWGLVIVTAGWDGRIKSFHNYGLPVSVWNPSGLAEGFHFPENHNSDSFVWALNKTLLWLPHAAYLMLGKRTSDFMLGSINRHNRFCFEHFVGMCSMDDFENFVFFQRAPSQISVVLLGI